MGQPMPVEGEPAQTGVLPWRGSTQLRASNRPKRVDMDRFPVTSHSPLPGFGIVVGYSYDH